ncbi:hypothetical protein ACOSP7_016325 [Xanthoceras sorbifolium]
MNISLELKNLSKHCYVDIVILAFAIGMCNLKFAFKMISLLNTTSLIFHYRCPTLEGQRKARENVSDGRRGKTAAREGGRGKTAVREGEEKQC